MKSSQYTISWDEKITVSIPCWWRRLLRLPLRTVTEWQRRKVTVRTEGERIQVLGLSDDVSLRMIQIEEGTIMATPYVGRPPTFESDDCSWEGYPHPSVSKEAK